MNIKHLVVTFILILFVFFAFFFKIVLISKSDLILFAQTKIHISKAGFGTCIMRKEVVIRKIGLVRSGISTCEVVVTSKAHIAARNKLSIKNKLSPFILIKADEFYERPVAAMLYDIPTLQKSYDLLSTLNELNYASTRTSDINILTENINVQKYDFTLYGTKILNNNFYPTYDLLNGPQKIIFTENGGIQELKGSLKKGESLFMNALNISSVPENGYEKELYIAPEKIYAVRLRDGKHYGVLTTHSNDTTNKDSWGTLEFLLQPQETNYFNFIKDSKYFLKWISYN